MVVVAAMKRIRRGERRKQAAGRASLGRGGTCSLPSPRQRLEDHPFDYGVPATRSPLGYSAHRSVLSEQRRRAPTTSRLGVDPSQR